MLKTYAIQIDTPLQNVQFAVVEVEHLQDFRSDVLSAIRSEFGPIAKISPEGFPIEVDPAKQDSFKGRACDWCSYAKMLRIL